MVTLAYTDWTIIFHGLGGPREASVPTLLAMGNGRCGLRGTVPELGAPHGTGFYLAGFYDGLPRPRLHPETFTPFLRSWSHMELVEGYHLEQALVNCPDPLEGSFSLDGEKLVLDREREQQVERSLCMRTGETAFSLPLRTQSGRRVHLCRRRFADMKQTGLLWEECTLESETGGQLRLNWRMGLGAENGNISGIYTGACKPEQRRWYSLFDLVEEREQDGVHTAVVSGRTQGTLASFSTVLLTPAEQRATPGAPVRFVRAAAFACDTMDRELDTQPLCRRAAAQGLETAQSGSRTAWETLWRDSDMVIEGDGKAQAGIRHSLYQLLIACCRQSSRVSVAAKGLSGEGYRGMTFWDTDIHMLPFYLYTQPEMARRLVEFRCRTLEGARHKAKKYGNQGASYPWETGISGEEECESFLKLITHQLHITADVAYAIGRWWDAAPEELTPEMGQALLETARFWLSKGEDRDGVWNIPRACGPDELHLDSDNSAYVNHMAAHNLRLALKAAQALGIGEADELRRLADCAQRVRTMKTAGGLYEQCEGFFRLEDRVVYEDSETDVPCDTQTVKQADVIMLLYLLPHLAGAEELRANWDYYEPRTTHTSSLSFGVHGIVAARLGLKEKAACYLNRSLGIDLHNEEGGCADGAHLAANGMSWSAIVEGIGGVTLRQGLLRLCPALPEGWTALRFTLRYRGMRLGFHMTRGETVLERGKDSGAPLPVEWNGRQYQWKAGETLCLTV